VLDRRVPAWLSLFASELLSEAGWVGRRVSSSGLRVGLAGVQAVLGGLLRRISLLVDFDGVGEVVLLVYYNFIVVVLRPSTFSRAQPFG